MATIKKVQTNYGTRWRLRFYAGRDPETGTQKFITRTFDRKKEAETEETRLKRNRDTGLPVTVSKEPLAKYLRTWLNDVKKGTIRERTWADYSGVLRRYIEKAADDAPPIGKVRMDRLTPAAIQSFYAYLRDDLGLSPRTIRSVHAIVRQGLAYAFRTGAAARNVAELAELPRLERRKVVAMSPEEVARFLGAAKEDRYCALWCVLISGGLRPSEGLGLVWSDVDLDAGKLHVQRSLVRRGSHGWKLVEPKTSRSRRVVVLPAFAVAALKAHKAAQNEERLLLGAEYQTHGFVFATEFGAPLSLPNLYRRNYTRICVAAGLGTWGPEPPKPARGPTPARPFRPKYRLYDLRHTAATLLLRAGTHPKAVSERLGHSSTAFTMDVYSASLPDMQEEAAEKLEAMLGGAAGG